VKLTWSAEAWEDYLYWWQETDKYTIEKINELINDATRTPFKGKGNPEPLKYPLEGFWSRKISSEHRLIYTVSNDSLLIASCRYHD